MSSVNEEVLFAKNEDEPSAQVKLDDTVDSQQFLIFTCDNLKLGVYAECVVEILTHQAITYLPMVPSYIRGIINMRGQMIPIVDIRDRLGKPPREDSLVIVLNIQGVQLGILADGMDQMIDIPTEHLLPMPANSPQLLVSGMCSLPDGSGTMMVLDCAQLLPND